MTRNFSKISAALLAALTISAVAISTTEPASARMMGERMGRMGHMGHGHMGRGMGFGRGMAIGMGVGLVGALVAANVANQPYAESFNPQTGERIRSEGPRGRHVVTKTTADGKVTRTVNKPGDSASSFDPKTGVTTTSKANPDGSRTVTTTDGKGNTKTEVMKKGEPASASATDINTGETTSVVDNGNGTRTITETDAKGNAKAKVENNKNPPSATSYDPQTGTTITSIGNANGTRTVITTNAQGEVMSSEVVR